MTVVRATTLAEAVEALSTLPGALAVAGGTDLMVAVNEGRLDPPHLVTLRRVRELRGVSVVDGRARGGGMTTSAELLADDRLPLLSAAARAVGSPAQRNAGTVGGALGSGGAGDVPTALLALDAHVECAGPRGTSRLPLQDWLDLPERGAAGLVTAVGYDEPGGRCAYLKA